MYNKGSVYFTWQIKEVSMSINFDNWFISPLSELKEVEQSGFQFSSEDEQWFLDKFIKEYSKDWNAMSALHRMGATEKMNRTGDAMDFSRELIENQYVQMRISEIKSQPLNADILRNNALNGLIEEANNPHNAAKYKIDANKRLLDESKPKEVDSSNDKEILTSLLSTFAKLGNSNE